MNPTIDGTFPDSQYNEIAPVIQAVFADIQSRNIQMVQFSPEMTQLPPANPADAYAMGIYDRMGSVIFKRFGIDGKIELHFASGGRQYGPVRSSMPIPVPSAYTGLIAFFTVVWLQLQLHHVELAPWNIAQMKAYFPDIVNNAAYSNVLRTFSHNVLELGDDLFSRSTNTVGYQTDAE